MRYGVNGDPLKEGKLDLPELLEVPTPEERDWAREMPSKDVTEQQVSLASRLRRLPSPAKCHAGTDRIQAFGG